MIDFCLGSYLQEVRTVTSSNGIVLDADETADLRAKIVGFLTKMGYAILWQVKN